MCTRYAKVERNEPNQQDFLSFQDSFCQFSKVVLETFTGKCAKQMHKCVLAQRRNTMERVSHR